MKNYLILILVSIFFLFGCNPSKNNYNKGILTTDSLTSLVEKAISGDVNSNNVLSGLIDSTFLIDDNYIIFKVDSFTTDSTIFYYVLLEHTNPFHNRLAFYDEKANCYLIDKSLMGKLSVDTFTIGKLNFIKVIEIFLSKDSLLLKRLSLYRFTNEEIRLVYRSFAELQTPVEIFNQTITTITEDSIETKLILPRRIKTALNKDYFYFNKIENRYLSSSSYFDNLILNELNNFEIITSKNQ